MAELTTEYLDKKLESFATNFDKKLEGLATKLTENFDHKIAEQTEAFARMVNDSVVEPFNRRFDELQEKLDVREQVEQHGRDIQEIKRTLKLA